jgi:hypothetical protein
MIPTNGELLYDVVMFLVAVYLPDAVVKQRAMLTIAFQNLLSLSLCIFSKLVVNRETTYTYGTDSEIHRTVLFHDKSKQFQTHFTPVEF